MLDEPSAGLDSRETAEFGSLLVSLAKERGLGIVLVEHDMSLVMSVCDEIWVLDFGKEVMHGSPAEVQRHPAVRAAYLGEDPVVVEAEDRVT
jgi:ABC-type branched-subunit amino acid transport system ATPase component